MKLREWAHTRLNFREDEDEEEEEDEDSSDSDLLSELQEPLGAHGCWAP